jgi:hypothetical protein
MFGAELINLNMKKHFKFGAIALTLLLASCGGEEAKKTETAAAPEKPLYDCECNTLQTEGGDDFKQRSIKKMVTSDNKPYTGTCATLSKDRSQVVTFLAQYKDGYPVKKQKWELFNKERIMIWDFTYDDKNKKSGYSMTLGKAEILDSTTKTKYAIRYTSRYSEYNKGRKILGYTFSKDYEKGWIIKSETQDIQTAGDDCWNQMPIKTKTRYIGDIPMTDPYLDKLDQRDKNIKSYLDCLDSKKLKKWVFKEMKIDENTTVEDAEADIDEEKETK